MSAIHCPLMGALQPSLQQGHDTMDARKWIGSRSLGERDPVTVPMLLQMVVAEPPVGVQHTAGHHRFLHKTPERRRGPIGDLPHPDPTHPRADLLDGDRNQRLFLGAPVPLLDPTDQRLIDLDAARQPIATGRTIARRSLCSQVHAVSYLPKPRTCRSAFALAP